jgi:hypothetical protein
VTFARLVADPQPEYACRFEPAIAHSETAVSTIGKPSRKREVREHRFRCGTVSRPCHLDAYRPLQVWPIPLPIHVLAVFPAGTPCKFLWLGKEYTVRDCWGPERIETGWWRGCDIHRDYYIVETHLGTRLWLFREHKDQRWFLHGSFD